MENLSYSDMMGQVFAVVAPLSAMLFLDVKIFIAL